MKHSLLILSLACTLFLTGCGSPAPQAAVPEVTVSDTQYISGTDTGTGIGFSGTFQVTVTVEDGRLARIVTDSQEDGRMGKKVITSLTDVMIAANSPRVDGVTGATVSSGGFKEAVRNALQDAEAQK